MARARKHGELGVLVQAEHLDRVLGTHDVRIPHMMSVGALMLVER